MLFYDFETFKYDWLVVIKDTDTKTTTTIVNDTEQLKQFYEKHKNDIWAGYNSRSYDAYILKAILCDFNPSDMNEHIIVKKLGGWQFSRLINQIQLYNYDVMTNKFFGLKQLEGFMGNNIKESDVSFSIDRKLNDDELKEVIKYCNHDVEQTMQVFVNQIEEFNAHMGLIKTFELPLKYINKTKAQLSAIILGASQIEHDDEFNYTIVDTIRIDNYREIYQWYKNPLNKDYKKKLDIDVAGVPHTFAWGGLHGARPKYIGEGLFVNSDVGSFYPSLMLEYDFQSRNIKDKSKYQNIYDARMKLKHEGKKKEQQPLKIVLNSTYGAMKDKYNPLFDPRQANNVCINGQLMLLDLIERVTEKLPGAMLIQSNTDGVMFKLESNKDMPIYEEVCNEWCKRTRMTLEHDIIKKVVQKDVNNYLIVMENGKVKSKGAYVKELNKLDNDLPIVNKALKDYFVKGIPVEDTINSCNELIEFQKIVKVSGKYKHALHGNKKLDERVLRVFASRSRKDNGVFKVHINKDKPDKIGNTPERCFIENGDINGVKTTRRLDKQYYIDIANKRIRDFIGE
ncbi:DNA polymerase domain-containing protein [Romboutsia sp. 1001713B170207_170306_H8]|uniref:DNA polymerase domain-containing protein n=1 Tax=Romboutsia sp. 1001713B170207_170306_H8 TaxID=2787112 RepID=UPI00189990C6|nr:DNA polymerase domain-containing protein [Romboutsia sp. 1001713B170207_170306_H8]